MSVPPSSSPGATRRRTRTTRSRGVWPGVGALVAVLLVAAGCSVTGDDPPVHAASVEPGWGSLSDSPLSPRTSSVVAWTGAELVVFGGTGVGRGRSHRPLDDAAAYSPATRSWRALPSSLLPHPLYLPQSVWTGEELVVVGVSCAPQEPSTDEGVPACIPGGLGAAALDPGTDRWRRLELPRDLPTPKPGSYQAMAVGWSGSEAVFRLGGVLYALQPERGRWRALPSPPVEPRRICPVDGSLVAVTFRDELSSSMAPPGAPGSAVIVSLDDGDTTDIAAWVLSLGSGGAWEVHVPPGDDAPPPPVIEVACGSEAVLLVPIGSGGEGWSFAADDRSWARTEPAPLAFRPGVLAEPVDGGVVLWSAEGTATYAFPERSWSVWPGRAVAADVGIPTDIVVTGSALVMVRADDDGAIRLAAVTGP